MSAKKKIDLNADMGESYGIYRIGNDEELVLHLTTVNVACGYHAADPATMRKSVRLAKEHGVGLGAHIGYPDIMGFGRRRMELTEDEARDMTVCQIGALLGFCQAEGVELQHVKPHGPLYLAAVWEEPMARGIAEGIASISEDLILLLAGPIAEEQCKRAGIRMAHEGYVDLNYDPQGVVVIEKAKQTRDPAEMARRAVDLVERQGIEATDGTWLEVKTQSICIHGDSPNAPAIAASIRAGLEAEGYEISGLRSVIDG